MFGLIAAITILPSFAQHAHKCNGSISDDDREDLKTRIDNDLTHTWPNTTEFPYIYSCDYEYCVYNLSTCTVTLPSGKVRNTSVSFFTPPGGDDDVRSAAKIVAGQLLLYQQFKNVTWGCDLKNATELSERNERKLRNGSCIFTYEVPAYALTENKDHYG